MTIDPRLADLVDTAIAMEAAVREHPKDIPAPVDRIIAFVTGVHVGIAFAMAYPEDAASFREMVESEANELGVTIPTNPEVMYEGLRRPK